MGMTRIHFTIDEAETIGKIGVKEIHWHEKCFVNLVVS